MKPIDLKDLIIALMGIIFLSIVTGQFGTLRDFALTEGVRCLKPWPAHHFFQNPVVAEGDRSERHRRQKGD